MRQLLLISLLLAGLGGAAAAAETVVVNSNCTAPEDADLRTCAYTVAFAGATVGEPIEVGFPAPKEVEHFVDWKMCTPDCVVENAVRNRRGSHLSYDLTVKMAEGEFSFSTVAAKDDYSPAKKNYFVKFAGESTTPGGDGKVDVLVKDTKISKVRPVIGGGITHLSDDFVDFKVVEDDATHIFSDNDSRWRAEVVTGALFKLKEWEKGGMPKTFDAAVNFEFAEGGNSVLDGLFFGAGIGLTSSIELVAGYSLARGKELSFGFQRAMGQFVRRVQADTAGSAFPMMSEQDRARINGITLNGEGLVPDERAFDGLPLNYEDAAGMMHGVFPGNPINNSFNHKFSVGFVIPIDIWRAVKEAGEDE